VSQKPQKASEEEKKKRKRKKKSKQIITRAVTHIRLLEANAGKLSTLDALMSVYLAAYQAARAQAEAEGRMASFKRREPSWTEWRLAS
jgi:formylglycine-generating enzyme required for sulfatase activity